MATTSKLQRRKPGFYTAQTARGTIYASVLRIPGRKDKPWVADWKTFAGSNSGCFDTLAKARKAMGA